MIVAMPHCGARPNSTSGGEVAEREILKRLAPVDVDAHVLAPSWRGLRWWNSLAYFYAPMRACLREHRPALIRAHSLRYTGLPAFWWGRRTGIPVTAHFHHLDDDRLAWLDRFVLRHADQVITDSAFSQRQAAAVGVTAQVVRLGVDHERFTPAPMPTDRGVLLIGGTKPRKNTAWFRTTVWPLVHRHVPDAWFEEAGAGTRNSDIMLDRMYLDARVVAFPSLLEGFGLPVLEAWASGRPVVMSDRGAFGEFGANVWPLEPDIWCRIIVALLTNDELWLQHRDEGMKLAARYSWDRTARALADAWRHCASA